MPTGKDWKILICHEDGTWGEYGREVILQQRETARDDGRIFLLNLNQPCVNRVCMISVMREQVVFFLGFQLEGCVRITVNDEQLKGVREFELKEQEFDVLVNDRDLRVRICRCV